MSRCLTLVTFGCLLLSLTFAISDEEQIDTDACLEKCELLDTDEDRNNCILKECADEIEEEKRGRSAFVRIGKKDDDEGSEMEKRQSRFVRIGKAARNRFVRIGRRAPSNFVRIGKGSPSKFVRIGKANPGAFVRIGKSPGGGFVRIGKQDPGSLSGIGDGDDEFERVAKANNPNSFVRIGRGRPNSFVRIGKGHPSSFVRIGKASKSAFVRIGKALAASGWGQDVEDSPEVERRADRNSFVRIG